MSEFLMQESSNDSYQPDPILDLDADFLSVECLELLGLDENPFIDHARDPFLFIDQQLEMSVNVLVDYLQNQNSTLALLGEIGIGKTTLLRILLRKGYQHFNFCTLRAKSNTTYTQVQEKIRERWRIPIDDQDENIECAEYITRYIESDKHPVIIIDDAHRLRTHELDALLQLKHRVGLQSSKNLGLVLAAEPSIQSKLTELEQSNPAATHIYQINTRTFDSEQCNQYIDFRLKKAGADSVDIFSQEQIQEFYTKSQGLPRVVNSLAREALTERCQQQTRRANQTQNFNLTPGMRLGLIAATLLGLAILAGTFLKQPKEELVELDLNKPEVDTEKIEIESSTKPEIKKTPEANQESVTQESVTQESVTQESVTIDKPKETKQVLKPYVAPLVLGPLQIEEPASDDEPSESKQVAEETLPFSPEWLLQQDASSYTVQIVASPNQESLFAFTKKNFADELTAYYKKSNKDKQWYILVYGTYSSREDALAAIESLPSDIKKNKPYVLQIGKIHEVIRQ